MSLCVRVGAHACMSAVGSQTMDSLRVRIAVLQQLTQQRSTSQRNVNAPPDYHGDPLEYEVWRRDLELWELQ